MTTNAPTLNDLNDIVMPASVTAWPPAPGVWAILLIACCVAAFVLVRRINAYRKNAYRRAALDELKHVDSAPAMAEILKRVCIQAGGRETVVPLQGETWFQWLEAEGGFKLSEKVKINLENVYSDQPVETSELRPFVEQWIRGHAC